MSIDEKVKAIKDEYIRYSNALNENDLAEEEYDRHPESEELEKKFDDTYKVYFESYMNLVNSICKAIGCTTDVAKEMIHSDAFKLIMSKQGVLE